MKNTSAQNPEKITRKISFKQIMTDLNANLSMLLNVTMSFKCN